MASKLTPTQMMLLSDLEEAPQWLYNKRTADALRKHGAAELRGLYLHITPAGRAALSQIQQTRGRG